MGIVPLSGLIVQRNEIMKSNKWVRGWLLAGLVMIFFQIVLGGITRLTGSGLSITKWDIVFGSIPPLTTEDWQIAFDMYKQTPQFAKVNSLMDLEAFKMIYFWEYIHRLWARLMGFVFIIPFLFFLFKGWFTPLLKKQLLIVFLLAVLVASFGWIMVASGLINRPWVNAYKLSFHLILAVILYGYLLWTFLSYSVTDFSVNASQRLSRFIGIFFTVVFIQIYVGGVMSGMKAGMYFPTWPDMNGAFLPDYLWMGKNWTWDNFVHYDQDRFMPGWVQFIHRLLAYMVALMGLLGIYFFHKDQNMKIRLWMLLTFFVVLLQVLLGISTVVGSKGMTPVNLGVLHQMGAMGVFTCALVLFYYTKRSKI